MDIVVIIVGLAAGIIILINPFIGLIASVVLMPQALIPAISSTFLGAFTMVTPIKIIGGVTFASVMIKQLAVKTTWDFLNKPQTKFFILFTVWIFISGFVHPGTFTRENFTVFSSLAVLGLIIVLLVTDIKRFRWVLWAGMISVFIVSLKSVLSYASFHQAIRMQGDSYGPNYFAIELLPFLGIAFYSIITEKNKLLKLLSLVIAVTICFALAATVSRGGFVGLAGMLLIAVFQAKKKIKAFLGLALLLVVLVHIMPPQLWQRFTKTQEVVENINKASSVNSSKRRYLLAEAAWKMFLAHPVFGVGVGNYYWECRKYVAGIYAGRAHTMYLEIMAELGIVGIFLFMGILFYTFKSLSRIAKSNSYLSGYARGLYIGLSGFLIAAIFLHAQQEKVLWFVIFMALALEGIAVPMNTNKVNKLTRIKRKF